MRFSQLRIVIFVVVLAMAIPTFADTMIYSTGFSSVNAVNQSSANFTLHPFDSTNGTLNKASVLVTGAFTAQFVSFDIRDPLSGAPQPCAYSAHVDQGIGSLTNTFSSMTDSRYDLSGAVLCATIPVVLSSSFEYSFDFDSTAELLGFTAGSSTGTIPNVLFYGKPSNFVDPLLGILGSIDMSAITDNANLLPTALINQAGSVIVTYDYTPTAPAPVPEPASLVLVASAVLGLGRKRKR